MNKHPLTLCLTLASLGLSTTALSLTLQSPSFGAHASIPSKYTCDGDDISPALVWQDASPNTQSYVVLVDDPDTTGGRWTHWVLFNIPANVHQLAEGSSPPGDAISGQNSWGESGYRGPCPPKDRHRYVFKLYALDTTLNLDSSAVEDNVLNAMQQHIISQTELTGFYNSSTPKEGPPPLPTPPSQLSY